MVLSGTITEHRRMSGSTQALPVPTGTAGKDGGYDTPSVIQAAPDAMEFSYVPSQEGMPEIPAKQIVLPAIVGPQGPPGHSVQGPPGEDGGYYFPGVTIHDNILTFTFDPSNKTMEYPAPTEIVLPAVVGPQGPPGLSGGFYTPSAQLTDYNSIIFKFTPSTIGLPEVENVEIFLPASDGSGTGSSDSGRKLVAAIHYSNQQELTPTAIDPETGHITVAETVQDDYWGWYCDDYFKFKVWEPSFDTANIPAKFLEGNGQPYAIARIDDHTVGLMKGHGAWGDPYDVPASLDLSLFTLIGTKNEEMPPVEGLNLQDFDLEVWGNHIRPYIYLYDNTGATIPVSKKDMIDIYYQKNFYNHLTLHRRGGVITGTISIVNATGTTNIWDLTFTLPPDAVVSKMQFARRYSPASEMNIRIYKVNGGAAGE